MGLCLVVGIDVEKGGARSNQSTCAYGARPHLKNWGHCVLSQNKWNARSIKEGLT